MFPVAHSLFVPDKTNSTSALSPIAFEEGSDVAVKTSAGETNTLKLEGSDTAGNAMAKIKGEQPEVTTPLPLQPRQLQLQQVLAQLG